MDSPKGRLTRTYTSHLERVRTFADDATALRYYRRNHLPFLMDLPPGPILDIGCGLGEFLAFADAELDRETVGLDLSAENVAACRERGLNAEKADVFEFLQQQEAHYAAIIMNDVLEHFEKEDVMRLLTLVHGRLPEGGRLLVKVPNMNNPFTAARSFFADFTHAVGFTEQSMLQVLETAGFREVYLAPVDMYVTGNPIANLAARAASAVQHCWWRLCYRLTGVTSTKVLTKALMACAVK